MGADRMLRHGSRRCKGGQCLLDGLDAVQQGNFGVVEVEGRVAGEDGVESGEVEFVDDDGVLRSYLLDVLIVVGRAERQRRAGQEKRELEKEAPHVEMRMIKSLEDGMTAKGRRIEKAIGSRLGW